MNNAKTSLDSLEVSAPSQNRDSLKEKEVALTKSLESVRAIIHSTEWSSLKETVFDGEVNKLKQELLTDSLSETPNPYKQRFLAGRLFQAKRYDLEKLESTFSTELTGIRKLLYGKEE